MTKKKVTKKSSAKKKKDYKYYLFVLTILIIAGLSYALHANDKWVETKDNVYNAYSLKHPKDWVTGKYGDYQWQVREPGSEDNPGFQAVIMDTTPLVNKEIKDSSNGYSAIWIAKLGQDGTVEKLNKNPLCNMDNQISSVDEGYYRCVGNKDAQKTIGVAIDVGDYAKNNNYNLIGGHKYGAVGIECTQGNSNRYKLEDTCEKIVKGFKQLVQY